MIWYRNQSLVGLFSHRVLDYGPYIRTYERRKAHSLELCGKIGLLTITVPNHLSLKYNLIGVVIRSSIVGRCQETHSPDCVFLDTGLYKQPLSPNVRHTTFHANIGQMFRYDK